MTSFMTIDRNYPAMGRFFLIPSMDSKVTPLTRSIVFSSKFLNDVFIVCFFFFSA